MEKDDIKLELYAAKIYLQKLSEKYKKREYEKIFLEDYFDYLEKTKDIIKKIWKQNDYLDFIVKKITNNIQKIWKIDDISGKSRKLIIEDYIFLYSKLIEFIDLTARNEDDIIETIDNFRIVEKEIDSKTKALTKYWFDNEFEKIFKSLLSRKHKEITIIIFDQNNLKTVNETYWHLIWQESIWKFWSLLKKELEKEWYKYILSNYFWWDEWFLVIIDESQKNVKNFVSKFFNILKNNIFDIKENKIKLWSCAWIVHYHPLKNEYNRLINAKKLVQIADTLVLQSKIQKNRNKSENAFKAINATNIDETDMLKLNKWIQTIPKKIKRETVDKKELTELFELRKKQNEKIMRARTLWVKKILRHNIDLINEVIWNKIIESISLTLNDIKIKTYNLIPVLTKKIINNFSQELASNPSKTLLNLDDKDIFLDKLINSQDFKRWLKNEIDLIFKDNILNINQKIMKQKNM